MFFHTIIFFRHPNCSTAVSAKISICYLFFVCRKWKKHRIWLGKGEKESILSRAMMLMFWWEINLSTSLLSLCYLPTGSVVWKHNFLWWITWNISIDFKSRLEARRWWISFCLLLFISSRFARKLTCMRNRIAFRGCWVLLLKQIFAAAAVW